MRRDLFTLLMLIVGYNSRAMRKHVMLRFFDIERLHHSGDPVEPRAYSTAIH